MNDVSFWGGVTLLLTDQQVDRFSFGERLKKDNIPTLLGNDGQYYFSTLSESYLTDYNNETIPFIKRQQKILLQTSWLAALLILLIACINYVNLNFSRLLEQIKFIKIQRLLGASSFRVGLHLFIDTLCTILIAFLLSLLIIHDLIPVFNSIVSGRLNTAFFLSEQILPLLLLSLVLFAVVVALTMSYRLIKLPIQTSRQQDSFIKKQKTIRVLSIIQNIVSLGLIIATLTVNKQLNLIKKGGDNYKQVYETGSYQSNKEKIKLFAEKIKELPEIESVTTSNSSILFSQIRQLVIKDEQGEENFASILEYKVSPDFNKTLSLGITRGLPPDQAKRTYARPVYVNQAFIDLLVPKDTNPIGQPLVAFDTDFKEQGNTEEASTTNISTIVGILENLHTNSIENHVLPQAFHIDEKAYSYVQYRFNTVSPSVINKVEKIFNEISSDEPFSYNEIFQQYMERNKKVIEFSNLLSMYALISLFLTAFGLFGTAYYTTIRRTKEIGIRQINGATNTQIFILLNKRFIKWIGIAIVLTIPPMWIILQSWLQHFAYRITITPDIFIVSGLIVSVITLVTVGWHSYRITARSPVKSLKSE
ncbi:FtsX-like permease family protein [Massilibacteroides sp.]|uniref:ABC transporter permease n=1 Tax=Massilibacteroides sp. TaxID=2034766 RepID=UPI00262A60DA|nr:FtsX-like permease family protein [Massilibacteroides sp.]MDD4515953.1 ABC transporter permease [Massilibacteroides sp.]